MSLALPQMTPAAQNPMRSLLAALAVATGSSANAATAMAAMPARLARWIMYSSLTLRALKRRRVVVAELADRHRPAVRELDLQHERLEGAGAVRIAGELVGLVEREGAAVGKAELAEAIRACRL